MSKQQSTRLADILDRGGIKTKEVWLNDSTGIITCWSYDMAWSAAALLQRSGQFHVRGPKESRDDAKDQSRRTTNALKRVPVWRVLLQLKEATA